MKIFEFIYSAFVNLFLLLLFFVVFVYVGMTYGWLTLYRGNPFHFLLGTVIVFFLALLGVRFMWLALFAALGVVLVVHVIQPLYSDYTEKVKASPYYKK